MGCTPSSSEAGFGVRDESFTPYIFLVSPVGRATAYKIYCIYLLRRCQYMSSKKLKCEFCGVEVTPNNYKRHIERHKTSPESFNEVYKLDHDGLNCKFCNKECKSINSLIQHELRCSENPNRRCHDTLVKYAKSHPAWNKGLTAETDDRVKANAMSLRRSIAAGNFHSLKGDDNPSRREDVRKKISETCLKKSKEGTWHTSLAKEHHYQYKGADLHGKWELAYAMHLDKMNIDWERCKERFPYEFEEKTHYYTPDFYLPETNEYVEIKGFKRERDTVKWSQFPDTKTLKVLYGKDLLGMGLDIQL